MALAPQPAQERELPRAQVLMPQPGPARSAQCEAVTERAEGAPKDLSREQEREQKQQEQEQELELEQGCWTATATPVGLRRLEALPSMPRGRRRAGWVDLAPPDAAPGRGLRCAANSRSPWWGRPSRAKPPRTTPRKLTTATTRQTPCVQGWM